MPPLVLLFALAAAQPPPGTPAPRVPEVTVFGSRDAPRVAGEGAPDCRPTWRLLADGKTFTVLCALKAGEAAHLRLEGFRNVADRLASPVELAFTADADNIDPDLEGALKSAGLKPEDGPVMDWAPTAPGAPAAASPARAVTAPTG